MIPERIADILLQLSEALVDSYTAGERASLSDLQPFVRLRFAVENLPPFESADWNSAMAILRERAPAVKELRQVVRICDLGRRVLKSNVKHLDDLVHVGYVEVIDPESEDKARVEPTLTGRLRVAAPLSRQG